MCWLILFISILQTTILYKMDNFTVEDFLELNRVVNENRSDVHCT